MLLAKIHSFISASHLAANGNRILLGVSGGIDSIVMAHIFLHLPYTLGIAHCNFTLRGEDSDLDEEFVRQFAVLNSLPFFSTRFSTKDYAARHGISTQMAARELRYEWFESVREKHGYEAIAIAHNLDDHAETMLINLTRGTGPAGLTGIKAKSGRVIRPLLNVSRKEIEEYAAAHGINHREDSSNAGVKYARNRIRHLVIPVLKEINPSILDTLNETSLRFSEINSIVSGYIDKTVSDFMITEGNDHIYDIEKLKGVINNGTILFGIFSRYGLSNVQTGDLRNIIGGRPGSMLITATGMRIVRDRTRLIVAPPADSAFDPLIIRDQKELMELKIFTPEIRTVDGSFLLPKEKTVTCIDIGRLAFPVILRKWENGDFFYPLGMKGRKKLSDYFIDMKYSIIEKERKLVLESDSQIVCIPCDRTDERYKVTTETKQVLILRKAPS